MIVITSASGRYGRLVVESLLRRGVAGPQIVAAVRRPDAVADLAAQGVEVRHADYDQAETLGAAFAGADKLLLIPSASIGRRFEQIERAVTAASEARVGVVAYAGFVNGDTSTLRLGDEHKQAEALIRRSKLRYIFMRNATYIETYAGDMRNIPAALAAGKIINAVGPGKMSGASRGDLAEAAAAALTTDTPGDKVYELGGAPFTMADVAAAISRLTGKPLVYEDVPPAQYAASLVEMGLPPAMAEMAADAVQAEHWYTESTDLARLLGRPSTPLEDVVAATLTRHGIL
ncbi:NAD(P)H-binding protein [Sphingobium subterraneum]|uniref:NAD(P)H dehydrogenase (Quinone) n=1 Tax=Sphingobium subterraneum TaxID=627688 RepID=A0A841IZN9_9SPHN|nr:NAD(P)H-binding protein [Sphingobium subterraneum]MBB6122736.1 NAD(P)H dehydrogenase (quinone) [Sphingobium subterraneum]